MIRGISYIVKDFVVANYTTMLHVLYVNNNGLFGGPVILKGKASFLIFRAWHASLPLQSKHYPVNWPCCVLLEGRCTI